MVIEEGVVSIGECAFDRCDRLKSVVLPQSIRTIGDYAFSGCVSLKHIELPEGLKTIGVGAFEECISLKEIALPNTVKIIPDSAFAECKFENMSIGESVKSIGRSAFAGCRKLKKVVFNDSLKKIGYYAFNDCSGLYEIVNLPEGVRVESDSFLNCKKLEKDGVVIIESKLVGFTSDEPKALNLPADTNYDKKSYDIPFVIYREDSRKEMDKVRFSEFEVESEIEFGQFPTDLTYELNPIKWKMIAKEKDRALLISTYGLIGIRNNEESYLGTWEESKIRRFLNKDFYNIAFSNSEKRQIIKSHLENKGQKKLRRPDGKETQDKVFMLSIEEVERYLKGDLESIRKAKITKYAKSKARLERARYSYWYTRTGGPEGYYLLAKIDCEDGAVDCVGDTYSNDVIRPAIWVKI